MAVELIPLKNGTTVSLDEFMSWSPQKQRGNLVFQTVSEETRKKLSTAGLGRKKSDEEVENIRKAHIGKKLTEATKAKISATTKGVKKSEETKAKMRDKVVSEETKAKISTARKGKLTAEAKAKMGTAKRKQVMTPKGLFHSVGEAAKGVGLTNTNTLRRRIKNQPTEYYYVIKADKDNLISD